MHPEGVAEGIASAEARRHIDVGPDEAEAVVTRSRALTALERLAIYGSRLLRPAAGVPGRRVPRPEARPRARTSSTALPSAIWNVSLAELHAVAAGSQLPALPRRNPPAIGKRTSFRGELAGLPHRPRHAGADLQRGLRRAGRGRASICWTPTSFGRFRPSSCWRRGSWACLVCGCWPCATRSTPTSPRCGAIEDPDPPAPAETCLAVTRRRYVVRHYELSRPAYQLLHALLAGESVGQAIQRAVEAAGPDLDRLANNLRTWFHDWAAEGFFRAVELAD